MILIISGRGGSRSRSKVAMTLQDDVYRQAEQFAQMATVKVTEALKDAIELSLAPVSPEQSTVKPVSELSDKEVLRLTEDIGIKRPSEALIFNGVSRWSRPRSLKQLYSHSQLRWLIKGHGSTCPSPKLDLKEGAYGSHFHHWFR